jgi:hypothetical protein
MLVQDLSTDREGNAYICGLFLDTVDFDPSSNVHNLIVNRPKNNADGFLAKYDKNGNFSWVRSVEGVGNSQSNTHNFGRGITISRFGRIYLTGHLMDSVEIKSPLNNYTKVSKGYSDTYIAAFDKEGNCEWVKTVGGKGAETRGIGIGVDYMGSVYATGFFGTTLDSIDFDPGAGEFKLINQSSYSSGFLRGIYTDGFLLKLACNDTSIYHLDTNIECGNSIIFNKEIYTSEGTYYHYFANQHGCDSMVILNLTIHPIEKPIITIDTLILGVIGRYASYQWILDNELISGATDSTYTVIKNGNYQVIVANENGCSDTSDIYPVTNYTSIEGNHVLANQIQVYPNPSQNIVNIDAPISVTISLSGIDGKIIFESAKTKAISIKDLSPGIYFLHIYDNNHRLIKVEKVSKQ